MPHQSEPKLSRTLKEGVQHEVAIGLNIKQAEIVNRLLSTGLYGNSPRQVIQRLLDAALLPHLQ